MQVCAGLYAIKVHVSLFEKMAHVPTVSHGQDHKDNNSRNLLPIFVVVVIIIITMPHHCFRRSRPVLAQSQI